jgi:hypothetical protein
VQIGIVPGKQPPIVASLLQVPGKQPPIVASLLPLCFRMMSDPGRIVSIVSGEAEADRHTQL